MANEILSLIPKLILEINQILLRLMVNGFPYQSLSLSQGHIYKKCGGLPEPEDEEDDRANGCLKRAKVV